MSSPYREPAPGSPWYENPTEAELVLFDKVCVAYVASGKSEYETRAAYAINLANEIVAERRRIVGHR